MESTRGGERANKRRDSLVGCKTGQQLGNDGQLQGLDCIQTDKKRREKKKKEEAKKKTG